MLRLNHGPDSCESAGHVDADGIFPRAIRSAIPVISVAFHAGVPPPLHFALTSATLIGPFLPAAPPPRGASYSHESLISQGAGFDAQIISFRSSGSCRALYRRSRRGSSRTGRAGRAGKNRRTGEEE